MAEQFADRHSAGAPVCEIEITDEMIDAGEAAADDFDSRFERPSSLVISIYRAMAQLAPRPKPMRDFLASFGKTDAGAS